MYKRGGKRALVWILMEESISAGHVLLLSSPLLRFPHDSRQGGLIAEVQIWLFLWGLHERVSLLHFESSLNVNLSYLIAV